MLEYGISRLRQLIWKAYHHEARRELLDARHTDVHTVAAGAAGSDACYCHKRRSATRPGAIDRLFHQVEGSRVAQPIAKPTSQFQGSGIGFR